LLIYEKLCHVGSATAGLTVDAKEVSLDRSRLLVRRPLFSLLENGKNKSEIIVKSRQPFHTISIVKCSDKNYSAATPVILYRLARKSKKSFADFVNSATNFPLIPEGFW
jgi:hypothetical protein